MLSTRYLSSDRAKGNQALSSSAPASAAADPVAKLVPPPKDSLDSPRPRHAPDAVPRVFVVPPGESMTEISVDESQVLERSGVVSISDVRSPRILTVSSSFSSQNDFGLQSKRAEELNSSTIPDLPPLSEEPDSPKDPDPSVDQSTGAKTSKSQSGKKGKKSPRESTTGSNVNKPQNLSLSSSTAIRNWFSRFNGKGKQPTEELRDVDDTTAPVPETSEVAASEPEFKNPPSTPPTTRGRANYGYAANEYISSPSCSFQAVPSTSSDFSKSAPYAFYDADVFTDLNAVTKEGDSKDGARKDAFVHEYERSTRLCARLPAWFSLGLLAAIIGFIVFIAAIIMIAVGYSSETSTPLGTHGIIFLVLGILLCAFGTTYLFVVMERHRKWKKRAKLNEERRRRGVAASLEMTPDEIIGINRMFRAMPVKRSDIWS